MKRSRPSTMKILTDFMKFEKIKATNKNSTDLEPSFSKVHLNFAQVKKKPKESKQKQVSGAAFSRTTQQFVKKNTQVEDLSPSKIKMKINKQKKVRKPKDNLEARERKELMKKIQSYCEQVIMNSPQNMKYFSKSIYSKILEKISPELTLNFNLKQDQKKSIECNLLYNILRLFKWDKITNFLKKSRHKVKMLKISTFQEYILKGKMFEGQSQKEQYKVTTSMLQSCLQKLRNRQYVLNELLQKKIYTKLYSSDKNQYFQKMIIFIYKIIQFTNFVQKYLDSNGCIEKNKGNQQEMDEILWNSKSQKINESQKNKEQQQQQEQEEEQEQDYLIEKQDKMLLERNQNMRENIYQLDQYQQNIESRDSNNILNQLDQKREFNKQKAVSEQKLVCFDTRSCEQRLNPELEQEQYIQDQKVQSYLFDLSKDDMPYYKLLRLRSIQIEQSSIELSFLFSAKFQRQELLTGDSKNENLSEIPLTNISDNQRYPSARF